MNLAVPQHVADFQCYIEESILKRFMKGWKVLIALLLLCCATQLVGAQSRGVKLYGVVVDAATKEPLPFAHIVVGNGGQGGASNDNGKFELRLQPGQYKITAGYLGYASKTLEVTLVKNKEVVFELEAVIKKLDELVILETQMPIEKQLQHTNMGMHTIDKKTMVLIPSLGGEPDVVKTFQLLPGTTKGVEGSTDFFVRGGDADQNLVLLDGATIYNTGHLLGFMSVFNSDAIDQVKMIKGNFPAHYGGRLSSVLDIKTKRAIVPTTEVVGNIGLISSRLGVNVPIVKNKLDVKLGARRTYIDRLLRVIDDPDMQLPYYFYDFNASLNYHQNEKNEFFISTYLGTDILNFDKVSGNRKERFNSNFDLTSSSISAGWNRNINQKQLSVLFYKTDYKYDISNVVSSDEEPDKIRLKSDIEDLGLKLRIVNLNGKGWSYGLESVWHNISPSLVETSGFIESLLPSSRSNGLETWEWAAYINYNFRMGNKLEGDVGYRHSASLSRTTAYNMPEPRLGIRFTLSELQSLKFGYARNAQYMHRVSSSSVSLPVDLWYSVTDKIKPQSADQVSFGYFHYFPKKGVILESEVYYKKMRNLTEYEEGTNLLFNTDFESSLIQGDGQAYGWEVLLKKEASKLSGWVSYTLSKSDRQFKDLNDGVAFPAKYDRRHNVSVVGYYELSKRVTVSAIWEYISGSKFTPVIGQYAALNPLNLGIDLYNIYSSRNAVALSNAHRLDLAISIKNKPHKKIQSTWQFGVYNAYNRTTPVSLLIVQDQQGRFKYQEQGLFGAMPFFSYSFEL